MDSENMQRVSVYLPKELVAEADRLKDESGCPSRNVFFAKALRNYLADSALKDHASGALLTEKLARAVKELSEKNAKAISKGLFRYAVQMEMLMRMIANDRIIDPVDLELMRQEAVKNVRRTRGKISFEEIASGCEKEVTIERNRPCQECGGNDLHSQGCQGFQGG